LHKRFYYIICVTLFTTGSACKHFQASCSSIKTGTFIQHAKFNNKSIVIERNDSLQVEKDLVSGATATSRIKWITPCSYLLIPMPARGITPDKTDQYFQAHPFTVNIVEVKKSYYIFTCVADSADFKTVIIQDTLFKQR
jgi:hypothetical protein